MGARDRLALFVVVALMVSAPAQAQRRQNCELVYAGTTSSFGINTPNQVDFLGGGVTLRCDGGTTIRSDSAVNTSINNRLEFIGNVRYADTLRTLTSDYLQYLGQQRLIIANNNVVLTDLRNGSRLEGPFLSYYLETETRPEEILQMPQGRPRATLVRAAQDTARSDTTVVDANMIEVIGQNRFVARGNVVVQRGEVDAKSDQLVYREQSNELTLTGEAQIESEQYTMVGDTIVALGDSASSEFSDVEARLNAQLLSDELTVNGRIVHVFLAAGQVDSLSAVGDTAGGRIRAVASSPDFRLEADSIHAVAPGQVLEAVHAFGAAFGERITPDSLATDRPELIRNDWVRGDTIVAQFADAPPAEAAADTAGPQRVLERLDASGGANGLASSLYRMQEQGAEPGTYAVNYMVARHIVVMLADGEVTSVQAQDQVHGLYLRPPGSARGPEETPAATAGNGRR